MELEPNLNKERLRRIFLILGNLKLAAVADPQMVAYERCKCRRDRNTTRAIYAGCVVVIEGN